MQKGVIMHNSRAGGECSIHIYTVSLGVGRMPGEGGAVGSRTFEAFHHATIVLVLPLVEGGQQRLPRVGLSITGLTNVSESSDTSDEGDKGGVGCVQSRVWVVVHVPSIKVNVGNDLCISRCPMAPVQRLLQPSTMYRLYK